MCIRDSSNPDTVVLTAAAADLGYRPQVTFEDGLARTVAYFSQLHP